MLFKEIVDGQTGEPRRTVSDHNSSGEVEGVTVLIM